MDDMWNSIRQDTLLGLKNLPHNKRLIITGISLGGALTCLSYVDIAHSGIFDSIELVTFGAPRVGNKKWAAWFDTQTPSIRYFLNDDPIPVLPRCLTLLCTYGQVGSRIRCTKNKQECEYIDEDDEFSLPNLRPFDSLVSAYKEHAEEEEHQPEGYGIGILDHIFEYKNLKNYSLVDNRK